MSNFHTIKELVQSMIKNKANFYNSTYEKCVCDELKPEDVKMFVRAISDILRSNSRKTSDPDYHIRYLDECKVRGYHVLQCMNIDITKY